MARSLQQIMTELDPYYASSKSAIQSQLDAAPTQQAAEESGLTASLGQANDNILSQARQRGLGFSGIPVAEQAKYAATDYAPALANLKAKYVGQSNSLLDALSGLGRDEMTQAQGVLQNEQANDLAQAQLAETKREADLTAKANSSGIGGISFGGAGTGGSSTTPTGAQIAQQGKGFQFSNGGKGISAYAYSTMKGVSFRNLLQQMANAGDPNAGIALQLVGDDGYADPSKIGRLSGAQRSGLRALGVRNA